MKSFALFVLAAQALVASAIQDDIKKFFVYGSNERSAALDSHHEVPNGVRHDVHDATYLYDHPFVMVMKQEGRHELVGFLVQRGLSSLVHHPHSKVIHEYLRAGQEKMGLLIDSSKYLNLPEWEMPVTKFILPENLSLAGYARMQSEYGALPWMLVVEKEAVDPTDLGHLVKISEYDIYDHFVRLSPNNIPTFHKSLDRTEYEHEQRYSHNTPSISIPILRGVQFLPGLSRFNPAVLPSSYPGNVQPSTAGSGYPSARRPITIEPIYL